MIADQILLYKLSRSTMIIAQKNGEFKVVAWRNVMS